MTYNNKFSILLICFIIMSWVLFDYDSVTGTILYNFLGDLSGWHIEKYSNVLSPDPLYVHTCGNGMNDDGSLSINNLKIEPGGYINIEVDLLTDFSNISYLRGFFNLRSIVNGEELFVNLYLKTGMNYAVYSGDVLEYSYNLQLGYDQDSWHPLYLDTKNISNLNDVRAIGLHIYTSTGYGLIPGFYDYGHDYGGSSWRKFHFDDLETSVVPESPTFLLFLIGVLFFVSTRKMMVNKIRYFMKQKNHQMVG